MTFRDNVDADHWLKYWLREYEGPQSLEEFMRTNCDWNTDDWQFFLMTNELENEKTDD